MKTARAPRKAPNIWARMYLGTLDHLNFFTTARAIDTAGFMCAPEPQKLKLMNRKL